MSDQDYENTIARLDSKVEELEAKLARHRTANSNLITENAKLQTKLERFKVLPLQWTNSFCRPRQPTPESLAWDRCIADVMLALNWEVEHEQF